MSQRFQIEDLLAQDEHGVVFRAQDSETGKQVALRRIFPYGPDGGGLKDGEREAYEAGIQKFSSIQHAGLRTVIAGGCDPVDGMPFLATEWVEGPTLAKAMERGPVPANSVIALMQRALDLCATLSIAFNEEETVWLETSPSAIVISAGDLQRGFTFWVGPLKWLNEVGGKRGLAPLAKLMRTVLSQPHPEDDPAVLEILQNYSRWLEKYSELATIPQAREALKEQFAPLVKGAAARAVPAAPAAAAAPPGPRPVMAPARPMQAAARPTQPAAAARPTQPAARSQAVTTAAPVVKPQGVGAPATATQSAAAPAPGKPKKKGFKFMPLVTVLVCAVCFGAAGFQIYRSQQAKKGKAVLSSAEKEEQKSLNASIAKAVAGGKTEASQPAAATTPEKTPEPPPKQEPKPQPSKQPSKPAAAKPTPPKPPPAPAAVVLPANHAILGTWKYFANGTAYTRVFSTEGGVSYCQLTANGKPEWKGKVVKISGDDIVVADPKGTEMHHVIAKDGKSLRIEDKYQASK
ncbi:hypothetical protein KBB96_15985 [Luteolibacter ambystomatis]|uniref:Protein kinase domain-containing protein n=1 Tax=Luteolibacter ambystomatis TaxID=2824561 RepID=A0A975IYG2_9BACT|nr:hypothetical protein [Luteolibacter ambystomatis]QUE50356.1 hypothetical protein KBB96_15985 [Luteolibacter ambystomatis]